MSIIFVICFRDLSLAKHKNDNFSCNSDAAVKNYWASTQLLRLFNYCDHTRATFAVDK